MYQHPGSEATQGIASLAAISSSPDPPKPVKEFESVDLSEGPKKRIPKRVIHFSDGVLEEYSTDEEEDEEDGGPSEPPVDPVSCH